MIEKNVGNEYRKGVICVLACQLMWGFLPLFWDAINPIESWIIILYRIFTMFIYTLIAARFSYSFREIFEPFKERRIRIKYFMSGLVLTANWSIYIWAVTSGRVVQSSIGYYIEPLVICLFGIVLFKEKLTKYNLTAMFLALLAVAIILVHFGQIPAVALGLALTWATYSAIKKSSEIPAIIALVYETMIFAVIALAVIIYIEAKGFGGLSYHLPGKYAMLFLTGLVTVIPVGLFGIAAPKVSMLLVGLMQYVSPTITLLCGVFIMGEKIDSVEIIAFIIIWIGLVFFTMGEVKEHKQKAVK